MYTFWRVVWLFLQAAMQNLLDFIKLYYFNLYNNQINAHAPIGNQLWVIVPVNPRKNHASSELLYKSNRSQVSVG